MRLWGRKDSRRGGRAGCVRGALRRSVSRRRRGFRSLRFSSSSCNWLEGLV